MKGKIALTAAAALTLITPSICAPAQAATERVKNSCFHARNISNFRAPDNKTVYLRVGVRDIYQLDLFGACPDVDWNEQIAVASRGGPWICTGFDAEIISPSSIGPHRCQVRTVKKLTPTEVAALPKKARP